MKDAPSKLNVSVHVSDPDTKAIKEQFNKEHQWVKAQMQANLQSINDMLTDERKRAMEQFKEYDGIWFGHYGQ